MSGSLDHKLRLCLVVVKYFSKILFSGKENIFKCLVALWKLLYKIFLYVWFYSENAIFLQIFQGFSTIFSASKQISLQKISKSQSQPQIFQGFSAIFLMPLPHHHNNRERSVGRRRDWAAWCDRWDLVRAIVGLELGVHRRRQRRDLGFLSFLSHALSLSLSLSLSLCVWPINGLKWKFELQTISMVKASFYTINFK